MEAQETMGTGPMGMETAGLTMEKNFMRILALGSQPKT